MLIFLAAFFLWALVHSITASNRFKHRVSVLIGKRAYNGWYRLLYNLTSAGTFLPILIIGSVLIPADLVWKVPSPFDTIFFAVRLLGLLGLAISLWQTDIFRFAGLSQLQRYLSGKTDVYLPPVMVTRGAYAYVRHPLYLFSLLVIWFSPIMTVQQLVFNIGATVYFIIGAIHEERRLLSIFGVEYECYQRNVPGILPIKIR